MSLSTTPGIGSRVLTVLAMCGLLVVAGSNPAAQNAKLVPAPASDGAEFGSAAAVDGRYAVVGAPKQLDAGGTRQAGAAYVFTTDGQQSWRLTASDADTRFGFGRAVDIDGDVVVVGAAYAVYVFRFNPTANAWTEEAMLTGQCGQGRFGSSVAVSGDRILVGSPLIGCIDASTQGYVFFYRRSSAGTWELERSFDTRTEGTGSYYGVSVSMEGDTAVVGAPGWGEVFPYRHDGSTWVAESRIVDPIWGSGRSFGRSVSFQGGTLVVGTPGDSERREGAGAAHLYRRTAQGEWSPQIKLMPPPTRPAQKLTGAAYGAAVSVSGDRVVLGGPQADVDQQADGGVLVFEHGNGSWAYRTTLRATGGGSSDQLGTAVDVDGSTVVAGAPGHDAAGPDAGAAYIFRLSDVAPPDPDNQPPTARFSATRDRLSVRLDASLSSDTDGTIASYGWSFGDSSTASGVTTSHTYAEPGTYTITLTVTDNRGATGQLSLTLTLSDANQLPTAAFTSSTSFLTVSVDASGSRDPDGSLARYDWDFGDGRTGRGRLASHTYAAGGTYPVTLTVTDNEGATARAAQDVRAVAPPDIWLMATGHKVRNQHKVDLAWTGASSPAVDVYVSSLNFADFSGVLVETVPNTGTYTHHIDRTRGTTYTHRVCEAGTTRCSNATTTVFH